VFGAEPMPTMNTRERPRIAVSVSNSCCSLPIAPSVQEHHLANVICLSGSVIRQRRAHRRHHLGTTLGLQRADERPGVADVLPVGGHGIGEQDVHGVIETDHIEAVARLQTAERIKQLALACTIEVPPIEPELSITKITSRGSGFCSVRRSQAA